MRKFTGTLILIVTVVAASLWAQAPDVDSTQPKQIGKYSDLLERLQAADMTIDFSELRQSYIQSDEYKPYRDDILESQTKMQKALKKRNFAEARTAAESILNSDYLNLEAHMVCEVTSDSLGEISRAHFHGWVCDGLLDAILASGDGLSQATAYHVLTVSEEYVVLDVLGLQSRGQSLEHADDGTSYDIFKVKDKNSGEKREVYFNITPMMAALDKMFD